MAIGPREAQRRALREKGAGGIAVIEKPRTASPSPEASAAGGRVPPKPPAEIAAAGPDEPKDYTMVVRGLSAKMGDRLERERARLGLRSRNDVAVVVLEKGVPK